jgi:hypothetical protein
MSRTIVFAIVICFVALSYTVAFALVESNDVASPVPSSCSGCQHYNEAVLSGVSPLAVCASCNGSGNGPFACFSCNGTGKRGAFTCSFCNGRGRSKCLTCNGTGHVQ